MPFITGRRTSRSIRTFIIVVAALASRAAPSAAERTIDRAALRDLSTQFRAALESRRGALYVRLLQSTEPAQQALNHAPGMMLMFIRDNGMPAYVCTDNLNAAKTVRTWDVWPTGIGGGFYGRNGSDTAQGELAVWDAAGVRLTHQEFGGRVVQKDAPSTTDPHSTHVAGTLVAAGVDPNARGMSYAAHLDAYDWNYDTAEMAAAAAQGLQISSHSYGYATGWNSNYWYGDLTVSTKEDAGFGFYDDSARDYDQIAYDAPDYLICIAAGNDRDDVAWSGTHYHWDPVLDNWVAATDVHGADNQHGGYDTIGYTANAKNILTLGAVYDIPAGYTTTTDVVEPVFTSWGPTDDGRIKPDIVANGMTLYSTTNTSDNAYTVFSGTSMATPCAAGSINLLAHEYESYHGSIPWSSTLKALVIDCADEAGVSDGPDYSYGWGLLNTHRSMDVIDSGPGANQGIIQGSQGNGETDTYYFTVDAINDMRVTLAWTDPAGTPPVWSLNPPDRMLVNDLDLRVDQSATPNETLPWVLDPTNPGLAATRGDNTRDNVEQVYIKNAALGAYAVKVTHKGTLTGGTQNFSLVWRGMRLNGATPVLAGATPRFRLEAPYPNPAAGSTRIAFNLDQARRVSITVYDAAGRRVATLINGVTQPAGPGTVAFDTAGLPSGVYFVRLETPGSTISRKLTVIK